MSSQTIALILLAASLFVLTSGLHALGARAAYSIWWSFLKDKEEARRIAQFGLLGLLGVIAFIVMAVFYVVLLGIYRKVFVACRNYNDERIIRSMERDMENTARRMKKVAER